MNNTNQLPKGNTQINSTLRTTGSGRLKRPSKDLGSLNTSSKKPFLKEYSIAMVLRSIISGVKTAESQGQNKRKEKVKNQRVKPGAK
jgi:hypothetical protein